MNTCKANSRTMHLTQAWIASSVLPPDLYSLQLPMQLSFLIAGYQKSSLGIHIDIKNKASMYLLIELIKFNMMLNKYQLITRTYLPRFSCEIGAINYMVIKPKKNFLIYILNNEVTFKYHKN